jgi:hypothetical protein
VIRRVINRVIGWLRPQPPAPPASVTRELRREKYERRLRKVGTISHSGKGERIRKRRARKWRR